MTYVPGSIAERLIALSDMLAVADEVDTEVANGIEDRIAAAASELLISDEPRQYNLTEDGCTFAIIVARSMREATKLARETVAGGDYDTSEGTTWTEIHVKDVLAEERGSVSVQIDPPEPACTADEHDWQSPYSLLGGIKDNPGVSGHGGGVIIKECCPHCGKFRITDTWAQNPVNGEQGLESVEYADANDASEGWIASRER